jgi:hypothetical protein
MSQVITMATAVWLAALTGAVAAQSLPAGAPAGGAQKVRIGVYDSRMVALAFYNSADHRKFLQDLMTELKTAQSANDAAKVAALEHRGPALQNLMHYQVFSNASVPNVMEKLAPELPRVAEQAQVSLIVSKWDVAWRLDGVEYVDVTDALVALFHPDKKVLDWVASGKAKPPIPLVEAVMTLRPER